MKLPMQADLARTALVIGQRAPLALYELAAFVPGLPGSTLYGFLSGLSATGAVEVDADQIIHVPPDGEPLLRRAYGMLAGGPVCRDCGCSDGWACDDGCNWAEPGRCSACAERAQRIATPLDLGGAP